MQLRLDRARYWAMTQKYSAILQDGEAGRKRAQSIAMYLSAGNIKKLRDLHVTLNRKTGQVITAEHLGKYAGGDHKLLMDMLAAASITAEWLKPVSARETFLFLHEFLDDINAKFDRQYPGASSCKKNCSACCRQLVQIHPEEAKILAEYVAEDAGREPAQGLLEAQAKWDRGADVWRDPKRIKERTCVFLADDGSCKVYEARPGPCRYHRAVTPAEYCDEEKFAFGKVQSPVMSESSILLGAVVALYPLWPMPTTLIKYLRK